MLAKQITCKQIRTGIINTIRSPHATLTIHTQTHPIHTNAIKHVGHTACAAPHKHMYARLQIETYRMDDNVVYHTTLT